MKTQRTRWTCARGAVLASLLLAGQVRALDVIDPSGANYFNITDSSHYGGGWEALHMFNWDLSAVAVGSVLTGSEFAKSGGGTSFVAFDMDKVYSGIGSIFYAQRQGANATMDKINQISLWASSTTPFTAADPGTAPDSVIPITNTTGGLWLEYLMTNTVAGQYFLLKLEQTVASGNPGGNEFRLGASLGLPPAVIGVNPVFTNTYTGNAMKFVAQANGTAPLSYQWQAGAMGAGTFTNLTDNANVSGTVSEALTLRNLALGDVDYQVIVANLYGKATSSPPATLIVSASLPQMLSPVTPETVQQAYGYSFSLSVDVVGSFPITYQWKRNGVNLSNDGRISGANSNVLTVANAESGDAGAYQLFANNAFGDATSTEATVTVVPSLPVIGPAGTIYSNVRDSSHFNASYVAANLFTHDVTSLAPGSTLTGAEFAKSGPGTAWVAFEVDTIYTVGSVYFAQRQGANTGDNMQKMSIWASDTDAFSTSDPGTSPLAVVSLLPNTGTPVWREYFLPGNITARYFLLKLEQTTITGNPGGNEMRLGLARLTPAIVSSPTNQIAFNGNTVQLSVGASGGSPLNYQWQARAAGGSAAFTNVLDSANISGSTSATLTLLSIPLADVEYRVTVSNASGSATSDPATLTVTTSAPQILVDASPANLRQPAGYSFSIPVTVVGSGPITYTWRRNGQVISNGGRISGAQSSALTIEAAEAGDAGTYQLSMSNAYGNSTSAQVTVVIEQGLAFYDGSAWTLNGGATIDGSGVLTLTDGGAGQFRSAFFNAVVPVDAFTASFVYQDVTVGGADGAAFILHNAPAGPAALGPGGGFLGYVGITPSAALTFNIYNNPGMALRTGGTVGGYASTAPVNIAGGSPILVDIKYAAGTMVVVLTDTFTSDSYTNTYSIDLAAAVGGNTAYVGFSGADGAIVSHQTISAFTYAPLEAGAPELVADVKPAHLTQPAGLSFSLSAAFAGTEPMTYQWKRDGLNLTDDDRISGTRSSRLHVAAALPSDVGNYQLFVTNFYGWTNSGIVAVTLTESVTLGDGSAWTLNGGCTLANETLTLTDGGNSQSRSAFLNARVPIDGFGASFTYTDITAGGADGVVFILHNAPAGPLALGAGGGALGYSDITPSAALEFNIYANSEGGRGIAFATNGLTAQNGGAPYSSTAPVDLASGNPIDVVLRYSSGVLSVSLNDITAGTSFATNYNVDLPAIVQDRSAYVGFSGGTGGVTAHQLISNVEFIPMPTLSVQLTATSAVVSWPVMPAVYVVQQSADVSGSGWENVTAPVNVVDGMNQVTVPLSAGRQFYRLALP